MRDALQAGMHADSKFKSRQKMNAAKNIQGLNNISAERLVSPIWARFSLLENKKSFLSMYTLDQQVLNYTHSYGA